MGSANLSVGAFGDEVEQLHRKLLEWGCDIPAGEVGRKFFGPATRAAIQQCQVKHGLTASGTFDQATAAAFDKRPVKPGGRDERVAKPAPAAAVSLQASRPATVGAQPAQVSSAKTPTAPPAAESAFVVRGHIRHADGSPLMGGVVEAFDQNMRNKQVLGRSITGRDGNYEIRYSADQFRRAEKGSADLVMQVSDATGELLASSAVISNSLAEATVDLMVGGGEYPDPSEYAQALAEIVPLLDGVPLAEVTENDSHQDVTFLARETGEHPQHIVFLAAASKLAQQTDLLPEVHYGLLRRGLPSDLPALLGQGPAVWRLALEKAVRDKIVPLSIEIQIDSIITALQRLAANGSSQRPDPQPGPGDIPEANGLVRLKPGALDKMVLDNLKLDSPNRGFINDSLNGALRAKLSAAFKQQGHPEIADAIQKMQAVDIATSKDMSMRSFVANHVEAQVKDDPFLMDAVEAVIDKLSGQTTIAALLRLDRVTRDHPLFQNEARKADIASLLAVSRLSTNHLQDKFISLYAAAFGSNEDLWNKLRKDPDFQAPGVSEDMQFTFQLGLLTANNVALVKVLRAQADVRSPRDLVACDINTWTRMINTSANGQPITIPDSVPGATAEERTANYALAMIGLLKQAFPTTVLARRISTAPDVDLNLVKAVLARNRPLDLSKRLPRSVDLTGLSVDDQTRARRSLDTLRQEIKTFPAFDYQALLADGVTITPRIAGASSRMPAVRAVTAPTALRNNIRDGVWKFLANVQDFDFQTTHIDSYIAANASSAFRGIADQDKALVTDQLKRTQRVFRVTPDSDQINALMGEGFGSAHGIAITPKSRFLSELGDKLGGQQQAIDIYSKAQHINARSTMLFTQVHQAVTDVTPRVIGGI